MIAFQDSFPQGRHEPADTAYSVPGTGDPATIPPHRARQVQRRIASGYYNCPIVIRKTAGRLLESGDLRTTLR
jgi:hypothetical protein